MRAQTWLPTTRELTFFQSSYLLIQGKDCLQSIMTRRTCRNILTKYWKRKQVVINFIGKFSFYAVDNGGIIIGKHKSLLYILYNNVEEN